VAVAGETAGEEASAEVEDGEPARVAPGLGAAESAGEPEEAAAGGVEEAAAAAEAGGMAETRAAAGGRPSNDSSMVSWCTAGLTSLPNSFGLARSTLSSMHSRQRRCRGSRSRRHWFDENASESLSTPQQRSEKQAYFLGSPGAAGRARLSSGGRRTGGWRANAR